MLQKARTDMYLTDSAVSLRGVTKTFIQWQRENTGKSILQNLIKPEKKVLTALDDVSFEINRGEFVAYAGPNGAGKSTTMKLLGGMLLPTSGDISVLTLSPQKERVALMNRLGILFGNRTELWWDHPVAQSFEWKKIVWGIPEEMYRQNLAMVTELLDIGDLLKTFVRELSLGQRMRCDLAMLLLHSPELILLDEPTLGLDVVAKRQMIDFLKTLNRERNATIVVTSHDMDDLEEMAQRVLMVAGGKIVYDGSFDGLRDLTGSPTLVRVEGADGFSEWEVDLTKTPINALMTQISAMNGIKDVEIRKAPIEKVISELYEAWS